MEMMTSSLQNKDRQNMKHSNDDCTQIKQVGVVKYGLQTQESFFLPHAAVISLFSFPSSSPSVFCSPCSPFALASRVRATLRFAPLKTSPSPPPPKLCMASSLAFSTRVRHRRALAEGQSVSALGSLSLQLKKIECHWNVLFYLVTTALSCHA